MVERFEMSGRESSSESEMEPPRPKKMCSSKSSTNNRASSRQSEKAQDIQEKMLLPPVLQKLEENVRELKEDVHLIKNRIDMLNPKCGANMTVETTVENSFEVLRPFGFRANSLEETGG